MAGTHLTQVGRVEMTTRPTCVLTNPVNAALVLPTGSRSWPDRRALEDTLLDVWHDALQDGWDGIELMHGCADGADTIGDHWARHNDIPVRRRPADWEGPCGTVCQSGHRRRNRRGVEYCPMAGPRRNQQMVDEQPLLVIAAQHRGSTGTADCIRRLHTPSGSRRYPHPPDHRLIRGRCWRGSEAR